MTAPTPNIFDQTELLQLALDAGRNNNAGAALAYLKDAVARSDATALAHYLLGAEYAQLQMIDRAISQMEAAIALDPSLEIARFQLGLLWLTSGNGIRAEEILVPLQERRDNALHWFGEGLIHLIHDRFAECVRCLTAGIEMNADNEPLNIDMRKMLKALSADFRKMPGTRETPAAAEQAPSQHVFLSAYTKNDES
jgi:tetratricopeptide (TPR) repeat protein